MKIILKKSSFLKTILSHVKSMVLLEVNYNDTMHKFSVTKTTKRIHCLTLPYTLKKQREKEYLLLTLRTLVENEGEFLNKRSEIKSFNSPPFRI